MTETIHLSDAEAPLNNEVPLQFEPSDSHIARPYPEGHPARQFLERLRSVPLTPAQHAAIEEYSGNYGQQEIADQLRDGYVSPDAQEIDLAMLKTPLPQSVIVYRAEGPRPTTPDDYPPGYSQPNPCYVSTTLDETLARNWLSTATVSRIELPAGTPVVVPNIEEAEILLPRESIFNTTGTWMDQKPNGDPLLYVDKELIPGSRAIEEAKVLQAERDGYLGSGDGTPGTPYVDIQW